MPTYYYTTFFADWQVFLQKKQSCTHIIQDCLYSAPKETLNKARLTALYAICLQIFRHIAQKSLAIRQYACGISMQSAEKSDYASYAQALFSVFLMLANASSVLRNLLFFWKSFLGNGQNTRSLPAPAAGFAVLLSPA